MMKSFKDAVAEVLGSELACLVDDIFEDWRVNMPVKGSSKSRKRPYLPQKHKEKQSEDTSRARAIRLKKAVEKHKRDFRKTHIDRIFGKLFAGYPRLNESELNCFRDWLDEKMTEAEEKGIALPHPLDVGLRKFLFLCGETPSLQAEEFEKKFTAQQKAAREARAARTKANHSDSDRVLWRFVNGFSLQPQEIRTLRRWGEKEYPDFRLVTDNEFINHCLDHVRKTHPNMECCGPMGVW